MAYEPTFIEDTSRSEASWRAEIITVCHLMHQKGFIVGKDGNVSVRLSEDRYLMTPSGFSKGLLREEDLLVVDEAGRVVEGRPGLRPTSEVFLHLEAYRRRPDIRSVVHAHPPLAVALSIAGVSLARCVLPEVVMTLGMIPTTEYAMPASLDGPRVLAGLIEKYDALILKRHGSVTVGNSPIDAYLILEKVEHVAHVLKTLLEIGQEEPLPKEEIARMIAWRVEKGLMRPGQMEDFCRECGVCEEDVKTFLSTSKGSELAPSS